MIITGVHNPIKKYRQDHNLTQVALAREAGVTPQVILRLEQGLFSNIPVNVLAAITHSQSQESAALSNYSDWVTQERNSHFVPTSLIFEQNGIPCLTYRNLKNFYKSTTAVARFLVIQISMVQEYEKSEGHRNVGAFRTALREIGFEGIFTYA